MKLTTALDAANFAFSIAGALLLALNIPESPYAFPLFLIGCVASVTSFTLMKRWWLVALSCSYIVINIVAVYRWLITG